MIKIISGVVVVITSMVLLYIGVRLATSAYFRSKYEELEEHNKRKGENDGS